VSTIDFVYGDPSDAVVNSISIAGVGSGSINVSESSDGKITGRIDSSDESALQRAEIRQTHDQLRIHFPGNATIRSAIYIELAVPPNLSFQIGTGSADVDIQTSITNSKIGTGSGDIGLRHGDEVQCTAGSGDLIVGTLAGSNNQLNTGSGDITVNDASATLSARAASGWINVRRFAGTMRASTASGDIDVPSTTGSLELRTASGDITVGVADDLPAWVDLRSVSGDVTINLDATNQPAEGEPYVAIKANSASGDVTIHRA
jgi:DUF4097 and DUF4098 domain-containing protein YvlB